MKQAKESEIKKSKRVKKNFIDSMKRDTLILLHQIGLSYDMSFSSKADSLYLLFLQPWRGPETSVLPD